MRVFRSGNRLSHQIRDQIADLLEFQAVQQALRHQRNRRGRLLLDFVALDHDFAEPTGYGLGKSGWVTARFGVDEKPPLDER